MKKLLLVLLLPLFAGAQIIEFADPNFKAYLLSANEENWIAEDINFNYVSIDTNSDGEIQESEAEVIQGLWIFDDLTISSIEGIKEFNNLKSFAANESSILTFDLSGMANLATFYVTTSSNLQQVNLSGCSALESLDIENIGAGDFNLEGCALLNDVMLHGFINTYINLAPATSLYSLQFNDADFGSEGHIDLSGLQGFGIGGWENITGTPYFDFSDVTIFGLDLVDVANLENTTFFFSNTSMEFFQVTNSPLPIANFDELSCSFHFTLVNNDITAIPYPKSCGEYLRIWNNPITSLIIPENILGFIEILDCPLQTIYIKNGVQNEFYSDSEDLVYVCADDFEIENLIQVNPDLESININSYCSFTPGGDYNTISGTVRFDLNGDGCDDSDMAASQLAITIDDGADGGSTFTNTDGNYQLYTNEGTFTLVPVIENTAFTVVPATVEFADNLNNTAVRDFCIVPNGMQPDLEVVILPPSYVSQASDPNYQILLRNKGNQSLSGTLQFNAYNITTFGEGTPPDTQNGSILTWNFSGLDPFETQTFVVAPYIPIFYAVGENFDLSASCTISGDVNPADNSFFITDYVDVAFDLRLAEYGTATVDCLQGTTESPTRIGDYLHYMVRFENTGTGAVGNAVAKLIIDETKFDVSTFQMLTASHASVTRITGNVVEIIFEDINLPTDDENNDGYAAFKIKTKSSLVEGDSVAMLANVYFDYNFPIQTEEFVTTFTSLGVEQHVNVKLGVYPNPARDVLNLSTASLIESFEIYDTAGRLVTAGKLSGETQTLDVSEFAVGIYLVKAKTASGFFSAKWVKE
jgi:hypothetical protein